METKAVIEAAERLRHAIDLGRSTFAQLAYVMAVATQNALVFGAVVEHAKKEKS